MLRLSNERDLPRRGSLSPVPLYQGMVMSDDPIRGERLQVVLSPEELTVLDDFRFKERMPSRAAAVRELLERGLAAEGYALAAYGSKLTDYGVIAAALGQVGGARRPG